MTKQLELFVEQHEQKMQQKESAELKREYVPGKDFWKPQYAYQVREWLYSYCKSNGKKPRNFNKMPARRVFAIYYSIRKKEG